MIPRVCWFFFATFADLIALSALAWCGDGVEDNTGQIISLRILLLWQPPSCCSTSLLQPMPMDSISPMLEVYLVLSKSLILVSSIAFLSSRLEIQFLVKAGNSSLLSQGRPLIRTELNQVNPSHWYRLEVGKDRFISQISFQRPINETISLLKSPIIYRPQGSGESI